MYKQLSKYTIEFLTIVLGISVSFWGENYRQKKMIMNEEWKRG